MELFLLPLLLLGVLFTTLDGGSDGPDDTADNDTLEGAGNDTVSGGAGDDDITLHDSATGFGGVGDDQLTVNDAANGFGGTGDDTLYAYTGGNAYGREGADHIQTGGTAHGLGGTGDDSLWAYDNSLGFGMEGNDGLWAADKASISGGQGDDTLQAEDAAVAHGDAGADTLYARDDATAYGGAGDDWLKADGHARLYGGLGDDTLNLNANEGGDGLGDGGAGNDLILVSGHTAVSGGDGNDTFVSDLARTEPSLGRASPEILDYDPATDTVGVLLGTRDLSDITVETSYNATLDATIVRLTRAPSVGVLALDSTIQLNGVDDYDLNDLVLYGNDLNDVLVWEPDPAGANDTLTGAGHDTVTGGAGNDVLTVTEDSTGFGGAGDDTLNASGNATGYGREGDDSLTGTGNAVVMGGDGNDVLTASGEGEAHGGAGDDLLTVSGDVRGFAANGNDTIHASDNAVVNGGDGNDVLEAEGNASVAGGEGNDDILLDAQFGLEGGLPVGLGEGGNDVLFANVGTADGGAGDDTLGGQGFGAHPNYAGLGTTLTGGAGNDLLVGYYNVDLRGGDGDDRLVLGEGSDADGGAGNDTILISPSVYVDDTDASVSVANVSGGTGADRFIVDTSNIREVLAGPEIVISDFAKGEDRLQVELLASGNLDAGRLDRFEITEDPAGGFTDVTFYHQGTDFTGAPVEIETQVRLVGVVGLDAADIEYVAQVGTQFAAGEVIEPALGTAMVHNTGTAGADSLTGQSNVWLETGDGNDQVSTGPTGDVVADMGDGADRFTGNGASAFVFGGAGDDLIDVRSISAPNTGPQTMEGGTDGRLDGGAGNDTLIAGDAAADLVLYGGDGDDALSLNMGQRADGGAGADHYTVSVTPETIAEGYMAQISWEPGDSIAMDIAGAVDGEVTLVHGHWDNGEPTGISTVLVGGVPVLSISHATSALPSL